MNSKKFERQIERIHSLIDGKDASVTWDDRVPDPDNPKQPRQIDITIRYADSFTIIECRIHAKPQDVKWIEELIGRRESLRADAVIAVSASGFTEGAIRKAEKFGIILRDFYTLSEDEIRGWGKTTKVDLTFFEFKDVVIGFVINIFKFGPDITISDENGENIVWRGVFESLMDELDKKNLKVGQVGTFNTEFDQNPIFVDGVKPLKVTMSGKARMLNRSVNLASVVTYAHPSEQVSIRESVHVERYDLGDFEIIKNTDVVTAVVDLSQIEIPEDSFFYTVNFDFGRIVTFRNPKFIGLREAMDWNSKIRFRFQTPG